MPRTKASNRTSSLNRVSIQNFPCSLYKSASGTAISGLTTSNSVSGWFKYYLAASGAIFNNTNDSNNYGGLIIDSNNFLRGGYHTSSGWNGASIPSGTTVSPCIWHFFTLTWNGTKALLYLDGALQTGTSSYNYGYFAGLNINQISAVNLVRNDCSQVNLMFFNTVLSVNQHINLYRNGTIPPGLVGWYPMTEGSQTIVYDISGNGNNITGQGTYTSDVPSKARSSIGGNLVYNGNFSFIPPTNAATTTQNGFIDGTSGGSTTNSLFGYKLATGTGSCAALFGQTNATSGSNSLKVSTTATSSKTIVTSTAIPVLPSISYTATYYMQTVANSGAATTGAYLDMQEQNASGSTQADNNGTKVATTNGLTQYRMTFTTNSATTQIVPTMFVTGNDGTGTLIMDAYFSSVFLQKTVLPTRTLV